MNDLDTREWLLTNGLGSFASGTVCDARTRTYHGWLIAALEPPGRRTLLLSHLDASLEVAGKNWALSTNFWNGGEKIEPLGYQLLRSFEIEPSPKWTWGSEGWQLTRQMVMPYGFPGSGELGVGSGEDLSNKQPPQLCNRILIQYRYEGSQVATLRLRLIIGDRDFHHQQLEDEELQFSQVVEPTQVYLQGIRSGQVGMPWVLRWSAGHYQPEGVWYWNYYYPEENLRGLGDREDLYSPGYLTVILEPGDTLILEARVGSAQSTLPQLNSDVFEQALQAEQERHKQLFALVPTTVKSDRDLIWRQLLQAGDQFTAYRASISGPTVIAGYPWFNDWGRDTLIALPGLALTTGRFALARGLLETFGSYCRDGLIPNTFPDGDAQPIYNSIDASLLWIETLGLYLETTQDWDFLIQQYPVVRKIYKAFTAGTLYNIRVDASDGLLTWDAPNVALTWMDVVIDGKPVTPRRGKPVEINALWYSALCWISRWTQKLVTDACVDPVRLLHQAQHYDQQAQKVKASLQKFWNLERNYFYDTIEPDDRRDARIRPNAVLALSLYHCGFPTEQGRRVLQVAHDRLLTPYGLRSLDPADPDYVSYYSGDRLHRDSAYHQGTVWSWLIGSFVRAWQRFYEQEPIPFDWQPLLVHLQQQACLGSISEIFDGNPPHSPQGAIAQAWSVAELIRHWEG
ncbi:MAG TPA: amylo-alpha-1,6-glucosidase [Cyanobacteria bacterium UBA8543]|nr:amylo-alpha-1,6-glucosidase [Cyanobacteria bacterium UBA8543]